MKAAARARIFPVVVLALAVVAVLKLGNVWVGFSAAGAQDAAPVMLVEETPLSDTQETQTPSTVTDASPPKVQPSEVERRILEKLASRHEALDARETQLETREALLLAAEQHLEERFAAFEVERLELEALRDKERASETEDIAALVSAYERMKSKDAARIFDALDEDILVPVASGMRTQALAGVLAEMAPEKARNLTKLLAERGRVAQQSASKEAPRATVQ